jgi:hypothetical protein
MAGDSEMQRDTRNSLAQDWRHALLFGLSLALLALALVVLTTRFPTYLNPQQATLVSLLLYLLIPAIAGYNFCSQRGREGWESGWAGLRVGLLASGVFLFIAIVWLTVTVVIYDNSPPSGPPSRGNFYSPGLELFFAILELAILAMLNFVGIVLSAAGGRIGGALAILLAKRLQQSPEQDV